jgi:hypothetical protein
VPDAAAAAQNSARIAHTPEGVRLYFPALRSIAAALPLALFGTIAALVPGAAIVVLLPSLVANAGSLLAAVLVGSFVLPFVVFGAVLVGIAVYMMANALDVRADAADIRTARLVFGAIVRRRRIARSDIAAIEAQIPTRYQALFAAAPSYHLYARKSDGSRIVVAETLRGAAAMEYVKALLENREPRTGQESIQ